MEIIFGFVYYFLIFLSRITGLSYDEINIIVYYGLIPFVYICLLDKIIKKHILKIVFVIIALTFFFTVKDFRSFSIRLFDQSVVFLQWFKIIGWNYVAASVVICVIIPGILFGWLFYYAYPEKSKKILSSLNKKIF